MIETNFISTEYLSANGEKYRVTVSYGPEAGIPEGAELAVQEILREADEETYEAYCADAAELLGYDPRNVFYAKLLDISILHDGAEIQPAAPVDVQIMLLDKEDDLAGASVDVVHYADAPQQAEAAEEGDGTVIFQAEGFSIYGVFYTVDFFFGGYSYSIAGGSSIPLSELFPLLGIEENAAEAVSVVFSDPALLSVTQAEGDWILSSLQPFATEESLTVRMAGGRIYRIQVTDANFSLTVTLGNDKTPIGEESNIVLEPRTTDEYILNIEANFDGTEAKDKKITVKIPWGYRIVRFTAKSDTEAIAGVEFKKAGDMTEKALLSASLKPATITNQQQITGFKDPESYASWESQYSTEGYITSNGTEKNWRIWGGDIEYVFRDDAKSVQLSAEFRADTSLFTHQKNSLSRTIELQPFHVCMSAGGDSVDIFPGSVKLDRLFGRILATQEADGDNVAAEDGQEFSDEFIHSCKLVRYSNDSNVDFSSKVDRLDVSFTYPEGVYFTGKGILEPIGTGNTARENIFASLNEIQNAHFSHEITQDPKGGGTIALHFTNVTIGDGKLLIALYFKARLKNQEGESYYCYASNGKIEGMAIAGAYTINGEQQSISSQIRSKQLVRVGNEKLVSVEGRDKTRRNYPEAYSGMFPYAIGEFGISADLATKDVTLYFTNMDEPEDSIIEISSINLPDNNIGKVKVWTTKGRVLKYDNANSITKGSGWDGRNISKDKMGLAEDEYIQSCLWTCDLRKGGYMADYTMAPLVYNGHFKEGVQDGRKTNTMLAVLKPGAEEYSTENVMQPVGDRHTTAFQYTTVGYETTAANNVETRIFNAAEGTPGRVEKSDFYSGDTLYFFSKINGAYRWYHDNNVTDPVLLIALPKGIYLDTTSVEAVSEKGNHPNEKLRLRQLGNMQTRQINGMDWNVYKFTSVEEGDMIGCGYCTELGGQSTSYINVNFAATVSPIFNSGKAMQLHLNQCVAWDLGKSAGANGDSGIQVQDENNLAGKNTDETAYYLYQAKTDKPFTINPLVGFAMDLSIKSDLEEDYHTYYGTESSIALVKPKQKLEAKARFVNTDSTQYWEGSEVYVPIPKKGRQYAKYFENLSPYTVPGYGGFGFSMELAGEVKMESIAGSEENEGDGTETGGTEKWKVWYGIDKAEGTPLAENGKEYDPKKPEEWEGFVSESTVIWKTFDQLADGELAKTVMLKFEALDSFSQGDGGEATIQLTVDGGAKVGEYDYWRGWTRAKLDGNGHSVQQSSSLLAATPAMETSRGFIYIDNNKNGKYDTGDAPYTGDAVEVTLMADGQENRAFKNIKHDGHLRIWSGLHDVFLPTGSYTVEISNAPEGYAYEGIQVSTSSAPSEEGLVWGSDANPEKNGGAASYTFTVENTTDKVNRFGIAMVPVTETGFTIVKTMTGRAFVDSDSFSFGISSGDADAPMPEGGSTIIVSGEKGKTSVSKSSGEIRFYGTGSYTYTIEELGAEKQYGIQKDTRKQTLSITVSPDAQGKLQAVCSPASVQFDNTYAAEPANFILGGYVDYYGKGGEKLETPEGMFAFSLQAKESGSPMPDGAAGNPAQAQNDASGGFRFPIRFNEAGTYSYTISQTVPANAGGETQYDQRTYTAKVTVTDNGMGQLTANASYNGSTTLASAAFVNHQNPDLSITKQVEPLQSKEDAETSFTVRLLLTDGDGKALNGGLTLSASSTKESSVQNLVFQGGAADITLHHGETVTVRNVPYGYHYTVAESLAADSDFAASYTQQSGVMDRNTAATVTNTRRTAKTMLYAVDRGDPGKKLPGAVFGLYQELAGGDGKLERALKYTIQSDEDGLLRILQDDGTLAPLDGLQAGTWYLVETRAPDGYMLSAEWKLEVSAKADGSKNDARLSEKTDGGYEYKEGFVSASAGEGGENVLSISIPNSTGIALPSTGGRGTWPYALGGMLLLASSATAAACLGRRRA